MSDMLDRIQDFVRRFPIAAPAPQPGRVEVGAMVHEWLARTGSSPSSAPPWGLSPVAALYGVPVVPCDDIDPCAWRLLDRDDGILAEGVMSLPGNFPRIEAPSGGILDRIDAAVDDWEHGPDAMHWSPEPAGVDLAGMDPLTVFRYASGPPVDGLTASMWIFDELQDYVHGWEVVNDGLLWQPADWEVEPGRADLPRDRIHALDRKPVPAAALAAADCEPLHGPGWLIDRRREATEVFGILAAAREGTA